MTLSLRTGVQALLRLQAAHPATAQKKTVCVLILPINAPRETTRPLPPHWPKSSERKQFLRHSCAARPHAAPTDASGSRRLTIHCSSSSLPESVRSGSAAPSRGVVITGGTRGLGLALALEFVSRGDRVVVCGRDPCQLDAALTALREHVAQQQQQHQKETAARNEAQGVSSPRVGSSSSSSPVELGAAGMVCDVGNPGDVSALGAFAKEQLGIVHLWINNAGQVTSRRMLADVPAGDIVSAVSCNVTGSILGSREAVRLMREQPSSPPPSASSPGPPYRIFNLGFSKWGAAFTQSSATHKATKLALAQLNSSLAEELKKAGLTSITVHNLSPGMVLTDLLLKDSTPASRRFFNALAEEPETVAAALVAQITAMDPGTPSGYGIEYLSPVSAFVRVLSRVQQIVQGGRFFDQQGNRVAVPGNRYANNGVRIQVPARDHAAAVKEELNV